MIKKLSTYSCSDLSALSLFALIAVQTRFLCRKSTAFAVLMVIVEASRSVLIQ